MKMFLSLIVLASALFMGKAQAYPYPHPEFDPCSGSYDGWYANHKYATWSFERRGGDQIEIQIIFQGNEYYYGYGTCDIFPNGTAHVVMHMQAPAPLHEATIFPDGDLRGQQEPGFSFGGRRRW